MLTQWLINILYGVERRRNSVQLRLCQNFISLQLNFRLKKIFESFLDIIIWLICWWAARMQQNVAVIYELGDL